jgi:hypothetical protein
MTIRAPHPVHGELIISGGILTILVSMEFLDRPGLDKKKRR